MAKNDERSARIGRDFSFWQLIWFCVPAIMTNLCTALFRTLDDGLFVSRYVGPTALAAIKIITPMNSLLMGFSHLFSIGASTLSAHKMGEGDREEAHRIFTRVVVSAGVVGAIFSAVVLTFEKPILMFLGADAETFPIASSYTRIIYADAA
ncbi:MAG: MATE family efflux transporter, partial [Bacillota bacterium]